MWSASTESVANRRGLRYSLAHNGCAATYTGVLEAWQSDGVFREYFQQLLAAAPYAAFRWETPAVTTDTVYRPFEFVLLDAPSLARTPEPEAFAEHFAEAREGVARFANLGGDALMIAPLPLAEVNCYGHLAAFVRSAPEGQRHSLWQAVGRAMTERVGSRPVWLSTAGAGVSWLHVRLDDSPKYYGYGPYRITP